MQRNQFIMAKTKYIIHQGQNFQHLMGLEYAKSKSPLYLRFFDTIQCQC
jgi:hypothetical protein